MTRLLTPQTRRRHAILAHQRRRFARRYLQLLTLLRRYR